MKRAIKKVLACLLPIVLAVTFVAGTFEIGEMLGSPGVVAYVLGSDDTPAPSPSPSPSPSRTVTKSRNPLTASGKTVELKATDTAKEKQVISRKNAIKVKNAKGPVIYKKTSGSSKITIDKKTGKITVKKGLKKGTYKVKVNVTAGGTRYYYYKTVKTTVKIKVLAVTNTLTAKGKTVDVSGSDLETAKKVIGRKKAISISKPKGKVTYAKESGNKGITIDSSTGDITVAKGTAPGTYKVKVKVKAAGNGQYKSATKTVSVTIEISEPETPAPAEGENTSGTDAV